MIFTIDEVRYNQLKSELTGYSMTYKKGVVEILPNVEKTDDEIKWDVEQVCPEVFYSYSLRPFVLPRFSTSCLHTIDYSSVRMLKQHLQRKNTWSKGSLIKVEYFESYNKETGIGINKFIQVDIQYFYDANGQVTHRETTRKWYLSDGVNTGVQTSSVKYYDYSEAVTEGIRRRTNNLNNLKVAIPGLIMQTELVDLPTAQQIGIPLFVAYGDQFKSYIEVKDPTIQSVISSDANFSWLDNDIGGTTIRQYLINELV